LLTRPKKLERIGIEKNPHGHRWTIQNAGTGIKKGSINSMDSSTRRDLTHTHLLNCAETNIAPVPDKSVQFVFQSTTCTWNEPLIMAMDVGHGYDTGPTTIDITPKSTSPSKARGMLFDCVDLCIGENSRTCILGNNGSGKSTLLRILAKLEQPKEGTIHHAHGISVGHFHQHIADDLIQTALKSKSNNITPLSFLLQRYPKKSEEELRGELSSFGIHEAQAVTNILHLSGGERCRLCLTMIMLQRPQVLLLDEPTNHLDVESVDALLHGLKFWNGTVVIVTHDANFIRSMGGECFVLMEEESKLRRVPGGVDYYLEHYLKLKKI